MKKIIFFILSIFCFMNITLAHVEDAQFVGGTGGSKIVDLAVSENSVDTSGIIYDKDASLVYEITYTNVTDVDKRVTDIKVPDTDIVLTYDFSNIDKNLVIKPGETVKFTYSIKSPEDVTTEQLMTLNEEAHAQLVFSSVRIENPETIDFIILVLLLCGLAFSTSHHV